jgi:hypothetical protein
VCTSIYQDLFNVSLRRGDPAALVETVRMMARRRVTNQRGHVVLIPGVVQDDIVGDVLFTLVDQAGPILARIVERNPTFRNAGLCDPEASRCADVEVLDHADRVLRDYIESMLANRYLDHVRAENRSLDLSTRLMEDEEAGFSRSSIPAPDADEDEGAVAMDEALNALALVLDAVIERRSVDEEQTRRVFGELVDVAMGDRSIALIVDEEICTDQMLVQGDEKHWKRARERIYRRHRLLRQYLLETVDALTCEGTLGAGPAELAAAAVRKVLTRRPRNKPTVVLSVEANHEDE